MADQNVQKVLSHSSASCFSLRKMRCVRDNAAPLLLKVVFVVRAEEDCRIGCAAMAAINVEVVKPVGL
jgi:hypothetical protein